MTAAPNVADFGHLSDVYDFLERHPELYTPGTRKAKREALKKAPSIYGLPLHKIPADPALFYKKFGFRRRYDIPSIFKKPEHFERWRALVGKLLKVRAEHLFPAFTLIDVQERWTDLLAEFEAMITSGGVDRPLESLITLGVLGKAMTARDRGPDDFDAGDIDAVLADALHPKQRQSLREGLALLAELRDCGLLAGRIPEALRALTTVKKGRPAIPPKLSKHVTAWTLQRLAGTQRSPIAKVKRDPIKESTAVVDDRSMKFFYRALLDIGVLEEHEDPEPSELADPEFLTWIYEAAERGELHRKSYAPGTIKTYIGGAAHCLSQFNPLMKVGAAEIFGGEFFRGTNQMCPAHAQWCLRLLANPVLQKAFMRTAVDLYREASAACAAADLDALSEHERFIIVRKFTIAAAMGIKLRCPLRISNLLGLSINEGPVAIENIFGEEPVKLNIQKGSTKNKRVIRPTLKESERLPLKPILQTYLLKIRPIILDWSRNKETYGSDERLFPLSPGTYSKWLMREMRARGLPMTAHMARHGVATLVLRRRSGSHEEVGRILVINASTVADFYVQIDEAVQDEAAANLLDETYETLESYT